MTDCRPSCPKRRRGRARRCVRRDRPRGRCRATVRRPPPSRSSRCRSSQWCMRMQRLHSTPRPCARGHRAKVRRRATDRQTSVRRGASSRHSDCIYVPLCASIGYKIPSVGQISYQTICHYYWDCPSGFHNSPTNTRS